MCLSLLIFFSPQILSPEENKRTKHNELPRKDTLRTIVAVRLKESRVVEKREKLSRTSVSNQALISSPVLCVKH